MAGNGERRFDEGDEDERERREKERGMSEGVGGERGRGAARKMVNKKG